jgi:hypothetical protein
MLMRLTNGFRTSGLIAIEALRLMWSVLMVVAVLGWAILRPVVMGALQVLAALILIFEEWGWKPLSDALAWLARFRLVARLEAFIAGLPPRIAIFVFAAPSVLLIPVKLGAVWLLAGGHVFWASALFLGAKVVGTALVARIFMLTRPALMQLPWFARLYTWFMPWKERLYAEIRASWVWRQGRVLKARVRHEVRAAWAEFKPAAREWILRARVWARDQWRSMMAGRGDVGVAKK